MSILSIRSATRMEFFGIPFSISNPDESDKANESFARFRSVLSRLAAYVLPHLVGKNFKTEINFGVGWRWLSVVRTG